MNKIKIKSKYQEYVYVGLQQEVAERLKKAKGNKQTLSELVTELLNKYEKN